MSCPTTSRPTSARTAFSRLPCGGACSRARCRLLPMPSWPTAITFTGTCVPSAPICSASRRPQRAYAGVFDRTQPVLGTPNEEVLKKAVGPQIADLYGTLMRSTPVFFLQDDHDYFENDEADDTLVTLPPDPFMLNLARASQLMYYPEFLPDAHRALGLPSGSAADRADGRFRELWHAAVWQAARDCSCTIAGGT